MEEGLDRSHAHVVVLGDALVAPALLLAQAEDLAVAGGELVEGPSQVGPVDLGEQRVVVGVDRAEIDLGHGHESCCNIGPFPV